MLLMLFLPLTWGGNPSYAKSVLADIPMAFRVWSTFVSFLQFPCSGSSPWFSSFQRLGGTTLERMRPCSGCSKLSGGVSHPVDFRSAEAKSIMAHTVSGAELRALWGSELSGWIIDRIDCPSLCAMPWPPSATEAN